MSDKPLDHSLISIYEEAYPVFSFLIDPLKRLSIPAAFGILGDAAGRDAGRRGWGYEDLAKRNQAWVLIRSRMNIIRQPVWGDRITLRTWPKSMQGVVAYRDFQVLDEQRNILMAGSTAWTLIDLLSRKPVRLVGKEYDTGKLADYHAISEKPEKIGWPEDLVEKTMLTASYGYLDMNNHVNNSRYLEWIINEIPVERMLSGRLVAVEANFIAEVQSGEEVVVLVPVNGTETRVFTGYIKNRLDNRPSFAARFTFAEP